MTQERKGVKIITCTCIHKYQDKKYGPGKRVHNMDKGRIKGTCTVCGKQN